jgi:iron complex transport system ATP-binding protein
MLSASEIGVRAGSKVLVESVSVEVKPGEVVAIVGANGAGKSTTLKALSGEVPLSAGEVRLYGKPLEAWPALERAQQLAVLPQSSSLSFGLTVEDIVMLGRMPFGKEMTRTENKVFVDKAMERTGISHLALRSYPSLSGGERLRTHLARVIAQILGNGNAEGRILLLDEPTSSLDLHHQLRILEIARTLSAEGVGVLTILHDLNLTMRFSDRVYIMKDGRVLCGGGTQEVLTTDAIETAFGLRTKLIEVEDLEHPTICTIERLSDDQSENDNLDH